jgi:phosphocarrier protein HPr
MPASSESITLTGDLHARPAGALAVAAGRFAASVSVTAGSKTVDAKSVLGVMGLGATSGQVITVSADGPDAAEAVAALIAIIGEATRVGSLGSAARLITKRGRSQMMYQRTQFLPQSSLVPIASPAIDGNSLPNRQLRALFQCDVNTLTIICVDSLLVISRAQSDGGVLSGRQPRRLSCDARFNVGGVAWTVAGRGAATT